MKFVATTTQPGANSARRESGGLTTFDPDVRVAVVGYGYWGSKHMRVLSSMPGVQVTIVDQDPERIAEARQAYPAAEAAHRLDEVIGRVDAVVVATPPSAHAAVALQALRSGRHALVEKPLATTVEDAQAMVDAAAANGVHLMAGHTFEYNAAVWKLKELIAAGELGRILYIDAARLSLGKYQRDCNVIWDLAPHDISIASFLLDEVPRTTWVWAKRHVGNRHADVAYLRLDFEKAATHAFVHVSWLDPCKVRRVTVVGDRKMAVYDDMSDNERIRVYDIGVDPGDPDDHGESHAMPVSYRTGDIVSPFIQFNEPLLVQDNHFIECIRTGAKPNTSGERGLDIVRVLAATDVAEATGRPAFVAGSIDPAGAERVREVAS
ncbi:MAG: Gfo/Idh/MocA family oxidoreductase [Actinomycetota bacterium]|nr:Gfo/Idh/MocA family oxidoreductase [Actinomycetota bacterium]MDQ3900842.1 Gfo/Idh/MocA family oxidoreductase [Actinomycetota bacterium]